MATPFAMSLSARAPSARRQNTSWRRLHCSTDAPGTARSSAIRTALCTPPIGVARSAAKQIPKWSENLLGNSQVLRMKERIPEIGAPGGWQGLKIFAKRLSSLGLCLCFARLGVTIVRFPMLNRAPARFPLLLFALSLLAPHPTTAPPQSNFTYGPLPVFELHSGFWINLHHTLYHEARSRTASAPPDKSAKPPGPTLNTAPEAKSTLAPGEQRVWDDAVAYYAANYAAKDLLFSTELIQLKDQLGDFEDCDELSGRKRKFCDAGLPAKLTQVLEAAAPVYRAHLWPAHDRANRRWIMRVAPLVREQGVGLSERLADIYQARWPREKIRVDVTGYANWTGAYTTADPLRVTISSLDSRNQGAASLEVLFHEGSP